MKFVDEMADAVNDTTVGIGTDVSFCSAAAGMVPVPALAAKLHAMFAVLLTIVPETLVAETEKNALPAVPPDHASTKSCDVEIVNAPLWGWLILMAAGAASWPEKAGAAAPLAEIVSVSVPA